MGFAHVPVGEDAVAPRGRLASRVGPSLWFSKLLAAQVKVPPLSSHSPPLVTCPTALRRGPPGAFLSVFRSERGWQDFSAEPEVECVRPCGRHCLCPGSEGTVGSVVVNGCCRVPEGFGSRTNSGMPLVYLLLINHIEQLIYAAVNVCRRAMLLSV